MRLLQMPDPRWTRGNAGEQCSRIAKKGLSCEAYAAGQAAAVAQGLGRMGLASMSGLGEGKECGWAVLHLRRDQLASWIESKVV